MATGIKDKVVILGMGCSRFGERWDSSPADLMSEAFEECIQDAGVQKNDIQAAWFGSGMDAYNVGPSGLPLALALRLDYIPVTKVENMCATGTEAFRGAVYAVASGAADIALALGVEKLKDTGYGGLPQRTRGVENDMFFPNLSAPGVFAQLASGYCSKYGASKTDLKKAMAHISVKSHANGAKNPKAHLQRAITEEQALNAPFIAEPIGLFDCCGVSDGAACAIVTTPEMAKQLGKTNLVSVKALQLAVSNGSESGYNDWDGSYLQTTRVAAKRAYEEAGVTKPSEQVSMSEVHDCFSITELVTMEDLQLSKQGEAIKDVLGGKFDADGSNPCQIDGGLKCFGHPIGASGLRMIYENYLQFNERAGDRQLSDPQLGLNHNLGGFPHQNVCSISIIGRYGQ
jgi:acetyl-CoA C-acetyltransferase